MLRDSTLDLLKFKPFPLIAAAVRSRIEPVMARWQQVVRDKLPTADTLTMEQLRDELPIMLEALAKTLESCEGKHLQGLEQVSEGHGQLRFHQSFNVDELMIEYGMLRTILIDEVITQMGSGLSPEQSAAMNMGIDTAVRKSVTKFTTYQARQLKTNADAQSKYLAFLSHDLRGGINGVLLMIEVLKRELAEESRFAESIHDLDSMRKAILDTVGVMDRFLHAERFRQGKVEPRNTTLELSQFITEIGSTFNLQARAKDIELRMSIAKPTNVFSDRDLLLLILQNLISNAIKYTPRGLVRVTAEKTVSGIIRISVADSGPGIAPDRLATLFEPFIRGDTHGQEGVGLGLSIAKQAADLIKAKLWAESKEGHGATFQLELPIPN
jgi:signal transduction histidine kinase